MLPTADSTDYSASHHLEGEWSEANPDKVTPRCGQPIPQSVPAGFDRGGAVPALRTAASSAGGIGRRRSVPNQPPGRAQYPGGIRNQHGSE